LQLAKPNQRYAVVFEDVEDALIDSPDVPSGKVRLVEVKDVYIRGKGDKISEN
jgi:hypothetical protein